MKIKLLGKNLQELEKVTLEAGLPKYTAKQIAQWLYVKKVRDIDSMTNLSKVAREKLSEKYEVGVTPYCDLAISEDGTKKYLFPVLCSRKTDLNFACSEEGAAALGDKRPEDVFEAGAIEAVMIPDGDRATLCVSSQSGCKMGCKFCMTGRQGFHGNLTAADIISQFIAIDEADQLTNTVFMGMGEPLDNYENVLRAIEILTAPWGFGWSPKRITVSSIGVLPNLKRYLEDTRCNLAISLHNPYPEERLSMMPAQKAFPASDVLRMVREYDWSGQRRISFEYTMFAGFNDDKKHADALFRLLKGMECRVNLIRFHKIPDFPYETSKGPIIDAFKDRLNNLGQVTTLRASRGEDILAACGMLAGEHQNNTKK